MTILIKKKEPAIRWSQKVSILKYTRRSFARRVISIFPILSQETAGRRLAAFLSPASTKMVCSLLPLHFHCLSISAAITSKDVSATLVFYSLIIKRCWKKTVQRMSLSRYILRWGDVLLTEVAYLWFSVWRRALSSFQFNVKGQFQNCRMVCFCCIIIVSICVSYCLLQLRFEGVGTVTEVPDILFLRR